jgi:hypothetical protein
LISSWNRSYGLRVTERVIACSIGFLWGFLYFTLQFTNVSRADNVIVDRRSFLNSIYKTKVAWMFNNYHLPLTFKCGHPIEKSKSKDLHYRMHWSGVRLCGILETV